MRYARLWLGLGLLLQAVILVLALLPLPQPPPVAGFDKAVHAAAFAFLAVWFLGVIEWRRAPALAAGLVAYGGLIELLQALTPSRMADPFDLLADMAGIGFGWLLAAAGLRHWCRWLEAGLGVSSPRE